MAGWKNWAALETVTEPDFQGYLQDQVVMRFASAAARDAALGANAADGMMTWQTDTQSIYIRRGGTWFPIGNDMLFTKEVTGTSETDPCKNSPQSGVFLKKNNTDLSFTFSNPFKCDANVTFYCVSNKQVATSSLAVGLYMSSGSWVVDSFQAAPAVPDGMPYSARVYNYLAASGSLSLMTYYQLRNDVSNANIRRAIPAGTITVKVKYYWSGTSDQANVDHLGIMIERISPPRVG